MIRKLKFCGLLFLIISCTEKHQPGEKKVRFDTGYADSNRVYQNETFNLQYKIPNNYYFLESTEVGIGRPCYLITGFADRNEKRAVFGRIESLDERYILYKDLNTRIPPSFIFGMYYSPDTTIKYLNIQKNERQVSFSIEKNNTEEEKQVSFSRELRIIDNMYYYFYPTEADLNKYQRVSKDFFGYNFSCIEATENSAPNRRMILGQTDYMGYTLYIRLIYKTDEDLEKMKEALEGFHL
ncbi:MAG: hypothetical protein IPP93_12140 [Chitinophagaceae bacterium]|nr:hypothetical protein [Chitinophagaceae bacterium]